MKNRGNRRNWVRILVNFVLVAGILGTGWKISEELIQRKQSADFADNLWKQVTGGSAGETEARKPSEAETPSSSERPSGPTETGPGKAPFEAKAQDEAHASGEEKTQNDAEMPSPEERPSGPAETGSGQTPGEAKAQDEAGTPSADGQPSGADETGSGQESREEKPQGETQATGEEKPQDEAQETGEEKPQGEAQATGEEKPQNEEKTPAPTEASHAAAPAETENPAVPKQINFEPLWEISKNAKAWLFSPDTGLSQAVAQTDNNDYYLKHLLDSSFNTAGTLFIDSRNKGDFTDRNTIIYGHSMRNKSMFGRLIQYQEADYCREHPSLYLYTPGHRFRLDIVATFGVRDDSAYYTIPVRWKEWETMLEKGKAKTAWDFGVSCGEADHFVTLSTCAYEIHQERWIVIARIDDPENVLNAE